MRVPQLRISRYELVLYAILPFLLIMMGAMPTAALFVLPLALMLLFLLYRRFGLYLPTSCIAAYGTASLVLNYDILSVVYLCFLTLAFFGLVLSVQLKPFLLCVVLAAAFAVIGALVGMGIVRLIKDAPLTDVAAEYIREKPDDPVIDYFARTAYDKADIPADVGKKSPGDDGYKDAVIEWFAQKPKKEYDGYTWYYCIHFGAVFGVLGYLVAITIGKNTASAFDADDEDGEALLCLSTRALGGMHVEPTDISDMRVPRSYLWACLLPALIGSIVLDLIGGYAHLSATLMHLFITLPTAFACITLLCYFLSLFSGVGKIVATVVFALLCIATVIFPIVLFVISIVGLCDIILNIRFWTEFIRS